MIFVLFSWSIAGGYFPRQYPHWTRELSWAMGVMTSLLVFASVLVHELAHSLVAIRQGEKVRSITLFLLGGVAQISEEPKAPLQEFRMAFVGPLTSFALAGLFYLASLLLGAVSQPLHASALYLAVINVGLGIFNLLPGFPLDGGRVFRAIVWKATGDLKKATRARLPERTGLRVSFHLPGPFPLPQGRPRRALVRPHRLVPSQRFRSGGMTRSPSDRPCAASTPEAL